MNPAAIMTAQIDDLLADDSNGMSQALGGVLIL